MRSCVVTHHAVVCCVVLQTSSAPKWGGFSFSKPAAEPEKPAEPAAPAKVESGSDMGNVFSSDMWNTPIKVRHTTRITVIEARPMRTACFHVRL